MSVQYRITDDEEFSGAIIIVDGETYTVSSDHPSWEDLILALLSKGDNLGLNPDEYESWLVDTITPEIGISNTLRKLSERVSFKDGVVYFDGDAQHNRLTEYIEQLLREGNDHRTKGYPALVAFMEKVYTNPSKKSRKHLFHFIETHGFKLFPDGDFVAYKGLNRDYTSKHAGYGIVDGVEFESANLLNKPGSVIEIPRSMVDANRDVACSTGLHAGTYAYANDFRGLGKLMVVKINPRDVVSVPSDHQDSKLRVTRYLVVEEATGEYEPALYLSESVNIEEEEAEESVPETTPEEESDLPNGSAPAEDLSPFLGRRVFVADEADPETVTSLKDLSQTDRILLVAGTAPEVGDTTFTAIWDTQSSAPEFVETPERDGEGLLGKIVAADNTKAEVHPGPDGEPVIGVPGVNFRVSEEEQAEADKANPQAASDYETRVQAMVGLIPTLKADDVNLRKHRSKRITAKNREPFDEAMKRLGLSY